MREGILIYNKYEGRYDIYFGEQELYGGLHCGETFEVKVGNRWKGTRIEMGCGREWYLVGFKTNGLQGIRVRI